MCPIYKIDQTVCSHCKTPDNRPLYKTQNKNLFADRIVPLHREKGVHCKASTNYKRK